MTKFIQGIASLFGTTLSQRLLLFVLLLHFTASVALLQTVFNGNVDSQSRIALADYDVATSIVAAVLQIFFVMHAFATHNLLQLQFIMVNLGLSFVTVFIPFLVVAISSHATKALPYAIGFGCELVVVIVVIIYLLHKVGQEIGSEILSASSQIKQMWRNYQFFMVHVRAIGIYIPTLYSDFLTMGSLIYYGGWAYSFPISILVLACVGIVVCMILAYRACRWEKRWLMHVVLGFYVLVMAMCIVGLMPPFITCSRESFFATLLLWTLIILYHGIRARLNFGKGLLPYFDQMSDKAALDKSGYVGQSSV